VIDRVERAKPQAQRPGLAPGKGSEGVQRRMAVGVSRELSEVQYVAVEATRVLRRPPSGGGSTDPFGRGRATRIARRSDRQAGGGSHVVPEVDRAGGDISAALSSRIRAAYSGRPIRAETLSRMERGFGASFSDVRVHVDSPFPDEVAAAAFTTGTDIHFAPGVYAPGTRTGDHLLAHELTHVVQQTGTMARQVCDLAHQAAPETRIRRRADDREVRPRGSLRPNRRPHAVRRSLSVSRDGDGAEREADRVAHAVTKTTRHRVDTSMDRSEVADRGRVLRASIVVRDPTLGGRARTAGGGRAGPIQRKYTGMAKKASIKAYAKDVHTLWRTDPSKSVDEFCRALVERVNRVLPYPCGYAFIGAGASQFNRQSWLLSVSSTSIAVHNTRPASTVGDLTQEGVQGLVDTIYHEARHSEQYFRAAQLSEQRFRAAQPSGATRTPKELAEHRGIPIGVAEKAIETLGDLTDDDKPQVHDWDQYLFSRFYRYEKAVNEVKDACGDVILSLKKQLLDIDKVEVGDAGKEVKRTALKKQLDMVNTLKDVAIDAYKAEEHEVDAYAVGGRAGKAFVKVATAAPANAEPANAEPATAAPASAAPASAAPASAETVTSGTADTKRAERPPPPAPPTQPAKLTHDTDPLATFERHLTSARLDLLRELEALDVKPEAEVDRHDINVYRHAKRILSQIDVVLDPAGARPGAQVPAKRAQHLPDFLRSAVNGLTRVIEAVFDIGALDANVRIREGIQLMGFALEMLGIDKLPEFRSEPGEATAAEDETSGDEGDTSSDDESFEPAGYSSFYRGNPENQRYLDQLHGTASKFAEVASAFAQSFDIAYDGVRQRSASPGSPDLRDSNVGKNDLPAFRMSKEVGRALLTPAVLFEVAAEWWNRYTWTDPTGMYLM
jgi:Domain of unknown function (DUF4157)